MKLFFTDRKCIKNFEIINERREISPYGESVIYFSINDLSVYYMHMHISHYNLEIIIIYLYFTLV